MEGERNDTGMADKQLAIPGSAGEDRAESHAACRSGKSAGVMGGEPFTGINASNTGCRHVGM